MPETRSKFLLFARLGFAARGLLYLIVGYLALHVGRSEDAGGALEYLGSGPGAILVGAMAIGFAAYGAWRFADALFDAQRKGNDLKGLVGRAAGMGSGLIHLGLAFSAARVALGGGSSANASDKAETGAATAMSLPGGEALLLVAAAILAAAGVAQLAMAVRRRFRKHLTPEARERWWINVAGCAGYAARGAVFLVAAWLALQAGLDHSPAEAGALRDSLRTLPGAVRTAVAAGLCLFGAYSLIEGWYRILPDPQVKRRLKRAVG